MAFLKTEVIIFKKDMERRTFYTLRKAAFSLAVGGVALAGVGASDLLVDMYKLTHTGPSPKDLKELTHEVEVEAYVFLGGVGLAVAGGIVDSFSHPENDEAENK